MRKRIKICLFATMIIFFCSKSESEKKKIENFKLTNGSNGCKGKLNYTIKFFIPYIFIN